MKTISRILMIAFAAAVWTGCQRITQTTSFTANIPQYISYEALRSSIQNDNFKELERPGKIFLKDNYILINDFEKGIHIYNNANPSSPQHVSFINIPGNIDIAVKDQVLYADSYVDLVAIDISDPANVEEIGRVQNALHYTIPSSMDPAFPVAKIDQSNGVVSGYTVGVVEETCTNDDCKRYYDVNDEWNGSWNGSMMSDQGSPVSFSGNTNNVRSSASSGNSAIAGSMARFMLVDEFLYVISDENTVKVYALDGGNMGEVTSFMPWNDAGGWGMIETLFTFKQHLFIGSNAGMLAYDISTPSNPTYLSNYAHMTACDPVVANDDFAFVTLRSNDDCNWSNENQMDVLDITDIMNPTHLVSYFLTEPRGLSIDDEANLLAVCDGTDGLKVYKKDDVFTLEQNLVAHMTGMETFDVIAHRNIFHVIGSGGLTQYLYNEQGDLTELSSIRLNQ